MKDTHFTFDVSTKELCMKFGMFVYSLVLCGALAVAPLATAHAAAAKSTPAQAPQQIDPATQETLKKAADAFEAKDFEGAKKLLKPLAEKGDIMATYAMGLMAARGEGGEKNMKEAESWWIKSANAGNPQAQFYLGVLYAGDDLGPRDLTKTRQWWTKAAGMKHADAIYNLGILMFEGEGGPKDEAGAVKRFREAANMKHPGAQFTMGRLYAEGKGVGKDLKQAKEWFTKAAAAGVPAAKEALDALSKSAPEAAPKAKKK